MYIEAVPPDPGEFISIADAVEVSDPLSRFLAKAAGKEDLFPSEISPGVWVELRDMLIKSRKALLPPLRHDSLNILDHLRALLDDERTSESAHSRIKWWEDLGKAVGVTEADLRETLYHERQKVMGDVVGCSWVKCMMYERECRVASMFRCANFQRAMYCGLRCQERLALLRFFLFLWRVKLTGLLPQGLE